MTVFQLDAFGNALGNAAIAGIEHANAVSEQHQVRSASSLLSADNSNSAVDPVAAYLSGPYAYTGNDAEALAGYNPFNGPLLASSDEYSTFTGAYGLPGSSDNLLSPTTPWYSEGGQNIYAGYLGAGGQFVPFTQGDNILQTAYVKDASGNIVTLAGGALSESPTVEITASPAEIAAARAGDITDTMTPLQMELMDTNPNSARYQTLLQQQRATQWVQAFNNYDYATMDRIQTEEQADEYKQEIAEYGRVLPRMSAWNPDAGLAARNDLAAAEGGIFTMAAAGLARRAGVSERGVAATEELTFNAEFGIAGEQTLRLGGDDVITATPALMPDGVTFEGSLYRAVRQGSDPTEISQRNVDSFHRYTGEGEGGLYFSSSQYISESEILNNGGSMDGKQMWLFTNSQVSNLLDLTDPAIQKAWGVTLKDLTRTGGSQEWRYEFTQPLGTQAKQMGYRGIIAPSAQADGGVNVILFGPRSSH